MPPSPPNWLPQLAQHFRQTYPLTECQAAARGGAVDRRAFAGRPVEYAEQVLGITTLTPEQREALPLVHVPPYRVLIPSAHDVGKTFLGGVLTNYWHDSFDPSVVLTTAPTRRDVVDLLWAEVRLQRHRAGLPSTFAPAAAYMGDGPEHYAKGFTARKGELFKGRHRRRMLFLFDEANEIDPPYWTTTKTMFDPADGHAWVAFFNPTSATSAAYQEDIACDEADGTPRWHRRRLSALTHPNVLAELRGEPRPIPGAVSLEMLREWLADWCEPAADPADRRATDVEWPPASGVWYRPGANFQSRALGIWPDAGGGVWGPALWEACQRQDGDFPLAELPRIGCDCATGKGEDYHAIHGRWGALSVHHETGNTMDPARVCARLKAVAATLAALANRARDPRAHQVGPRDILMALDDDGTGNAVGSFLMQDGYSVECIGAGTSPEDELLYPRRRDELWFRAAERARRGLVRLGKLDRATRARLRMQLLAPEWELDPAGRRKVEPKDDTKEKIGRSPDDADAMNLAYYEGGVWAPPEVLR